MSDSISLPVVVEAGEVYRSLSVSYEILPRHGLDTQDRDTEYRGGTAPQRQHLYGVWQCLKDRIQRAKPTELSFYVYPTSLAHMGGGM